MDDRVPYFVNVLSSELTLKAQVQSKYEVKYKSLTSLLQHERRRVSSYFKKTVRLQIIQFLYLVKNFDAK